MCVKRVSCRLFAGAVRKAGVSREAWAGLTSTEQSFAMAPSFSRFWKYTAPVSRIASFSHVGVQNTKDAVLLLSFPHAAQQLAHAEPAYSSRTTKAKGRSRPTSSPGLSLVIASAERPLPGRTDTSAAHGAPDAAGGHGQWRGGGH